MTMTCTKSPSSMSSACLSASGIDILPPLCTVVLNMALYNDKMIPVQYAKEFREIPGSELVVIKDCGHTPYVEKPMTFNRLVLKFLAGKEVML